MDPFPGPFCSDRIYSGVLCPPPFFKTRPPLSFGPQALRREECGIKEDTRSFSSSGRGWRRRAALGFRLWVQYVRVGASLWEILGWRSLVLLPQTLPSPTVSAFTPFSWGHKILLCVCGSHTNHHINFCHFAI